MKSDRFYLKNIGSKHAEFSHFYNIFLAHPNIIAFITQGGLQSIEEAISKEVPMVGIPFIGDQPLNVKRLVEKGMAVRVKSSEIKNETLKAAILEVSGNKRFSIFCSFSKDF